MDTRPTLRSLRLAKGMNLEDVAVAVTVHSGRTIGHRAVAMWEHRGCRRIDVLCALAQAFDTDLPTITQAAENSRAGYGPRMTRGRPSRKIIATADALALGRSQVAQMEAETA